MLDEIDIQIRYCRININELEDIAIETIKNKREDEKTASVASVIWHTYRVSEGDEECWEKIRSKTLPNLIESIKLHIQNARNP